jgi:hypothetical protein
MNGAKRRPGVPGRLWNIVLETSRVAVAKHYHAPWGDAPRQERVSVRGGEGLLA